MYRNLLIDQSKEKLKEILPDIVLFDTNQPFSACHLCDIKCKSYLYSNFLDPVHCCLNCYDKLSSIKHREKSISLNIIKHFEKNTPY